MKPLTYQQGLQYDTPAIRLFDAICPGCCAVKDGSFFVVSQVAPDAVEFILVLTYQGSLLPLICAAMLNYSTLVLRACLSFCIRFFCTLTRRYYLRNICICIERIKIYLNSKYILMNKWETSIKIKSNTYALYLHPLMQVHKV